MASFEETLKIYLDKYAENDKTFAEKYNGSGKTVGGCAKWIMAEARKNAVNGCCAWADAEVYGKAVHYFDEEDIKEFTDTAPAAKVTQSPSIGSPQALTKKNKPKSEPKAKGKTPAKKTTGMDVFAQVSKPTPAPQNVKPETLKPETPKTEHVDPFAHIFEEPKNMSTGMDLFADL